MNQYEEILKILVEKLQGIKFALIGSMGLRFQGIEIDVRDVDLLTDKGGIEEIVKIFNAKIVEHKKEKYLETKFEINSMEIHCVANLSELSGPINSLSDAVFVEKNNLKAWCASLESELKYYKHLNREKDQKTIKLIEEKLGKE